MIRVCGLANSKGLLLDSEGLPLEHWRDRMSAATEEFSLARLIALVQRNHIINPVLVDCTSSEDIANQYADFLAAGFHVVTPNKKQTQQAWRTTISFEMSLVARVAS